MGFWQIKKIPAQDQPIQLVKKTTDKYYIRLENNTPYQSKLDFVNFALKMCSSESSTG